MKTNEIDRFYPNLGREAASSRESIEK